MRTKNDIIRARSHGLRYFDMAVAKVGRPFIVRAIIESPTRQESLHLQAHVAVTEILSLDEPLEQTYNIDEALGADEIEHISSALGISGPHIDVWERKPNVYPLIDVVAACGEAVIRNVNAAISERGACTEVAFPGETDDSTANCKRLLALAYAGTKSAHAKLWRRKSKGSGLRLFECATTGAHAAIRFVAGEGASVVKAGTDGRSIEGALLAAAAKISHSGDEGHLFWAPATRNVWWVMAERDITGPWDAEEEIERILSIDGISSVVCGKESEPSGSGWKDLGYIAGHRVVSAGGVSWG